MRWFLVCALLALAGCGESEEVRGRTIVTIGPAMSNIPDPEVTCENSPPPPPPEERVTVGSPCEFLDSGECQMFLDLPPGPCTLLIRLRDSDTGETICIQEEDFVVSEVGDTEVEITLDNCAPVTMPF